MKKRRKRIDKINSRTIPTLLCMLIIVLMNASLSSCENSTTTEELLNTHTAIHDPSQPVTITSFTPETGSVGSQIVITGTNFGSDVSIIQVTIDDVNLPAIGADGNHLYAILGKELSDDEESGTLSVFIGENENRQKAVAPKKFQYKKAPYVTTLAGWINEKGLTASADGSIKEAQFQNPNRLALDDKNNLYVLEFECALRFIPHTQDTVWTLFRGSGDIAKITSLSFTNDYKTVYITNRRDDTTWSKIGAFSLHYDDQKGEISDKWEPVANVDKCYGGACHPLDNTYFYTSERDGAVYKWLGVNDPIKGNDERNSQELFKVRERETEISIYFHPEGEFAYLVLSNRHQILKSYYDKDKKELKSPSIFAGTGKVGSEDGVGTAAQFSSPYQGTFDEEGNFYVADYGNGCIRKITPTGIVSVFAGKVGNKGNVDGTLEDARFGGPHGIVYDKDRGVFYVADRSNSSIRMIVIPK